MGFGSFRRRELFSLRSKSGSQASGFDQDSSFHSSRPTSIRSGNFAGTSTASKFSASAATGSLTGVSVHSESSNSTAVMAPSNPSQSGQSQRPYGRRDRNFADTPCVFCEESLQHTLVGERVLHFTCSHVSHEECLYETVRETEMAICPVCKTPISLDVTRGGSVLDIEKLALAVRSTQASTSSSIQQSFHVESRWAGRPSGFSASTPTVDKGSTSARLQFSRADSADADFRSNQSYHNRSICHESNGTANLSDYADNQLHARSANQKFQLPFGTRTARDCDVQSIDSSCPANSARLTIKHPIPPPTVLIRSEFPTVTKLTVAQNVTCLVSVVVPSDWKLNPDDYVASSAVPLSNSPTQTSSATPRQCLLENSAFVTKSATANSGESGIASSPEDLEKVTEALRNRVEHWHNLDFNRFGKLLLHEQVRVGKDSVTWQDLECYLFDQMLICIKDKKPPSSLDDGWDQDKRPKSTLKGSILIQKHLQSVEVTHHGPEPILTLSLSVPALPAFHLKFSAMAQLLRWQKALVKTCNLEPPTGIDYDLDHQLGTDEEDNSRPSIKQRRESSINSSACARSYNTAPTSYSVGYGTPAIEPAPLPSLHIPMDIVIVVPVSSSMQGLKISLLRDTLRFTVSSLGERDRIGLVTFGSSNGSEQLVGLTSKSWHGWRKVLDGLRPVGQKNLRADVVEGTNVAMNLLMQRRASNPIAAILLISDSPSADQDGIDFVVSRAEAARVGVYSFGLGLTHKPDTMIELSNRTKAPYTYVRDWMMLKESIAGCLGWLQSTSHQNAKLRLRIPAGSPVKFVKITGALHVTKRASGRDAEVCLGDLVLGGRRDILVQLSIDADTPNEPTIVAEDPWESLVSGLEALGGSEGNGEGEDHDRYHSSIDELPLLQADLVFGDVLSGTVGNLPRPTLLTVPFIPSSGGLPTPSIPPNVAVLQRRMELLTSDMLFRALGLVSRGQHDRAHHLLSQTRSILNGMANGMPPSALAPMTSPSSIQTDHFSTAQSHPYPHHQHSQQFSPQLQVTDNGAFSSHQPTSGKPNLSCSVVSHSPGLALSTPTIQAPSSIASFPSPMTAAAVVDYEVMSALDSELAAALEWILHPAIFGRDSRKAVLQSIGVIDSQRAYTFHTKIETMWASRVSFVNGSVEASRLWREEEEGIREEV